MDALKSLQQDLDKGFSKSELERLIDLPKNILTGVLKEKRRLSKKSLLKIERWNKSDKPNPLDIEIKFSKVTPKSYDGKKSDNLKLDEVGQWKEPASKKEMPANLSRIEKMKWIRENN